MVIGLVFFYLRIFVSYLFCQCNCVPCKTARFSSMRMKSARDLRNQAEMLANCIARLELVHFWIFFPSAHFFFV